MRHDAQGEKDQQPALNNTATKDDYLLQSLKKYMRRLQQTIL